MRISVSARLGADLHWAEGQKVEISIGDGPDSDRIRLKASPRGYKLRKASPTSTRLLVVVTAWPGCPGQWAATDVDASPDPISKSLLFRVPWAEEKKPAMRAVR